MECDARKSGGRARNDASSSAALGASVFAPLRRAHHRARRARVAPCVRTPPRAPRATRATRTTPAPPPRTPTPPATRASPPWPPLAERRAPALLPLLVVEERGVRGASAALAARSGERTASLLFARINTGAPRSASDRSRVGAATASAKYAWRQRRRRRAPAPPRRGRGDPSPSAPSRGGEECCSCWSPASPSSAAKSTQKMTACASS